MYILPLGRAAYLLVLTARGSIGAGRASFRWLQETKLGCVWVCVRVRRDDDVDELRGAGHHEVSSAVRSPAWLATSTHMETKSLMDIFRRAWLISEHTNLTFENS